MSDVKPRRGCPSNTGADSKDAVAAGRTGTERLFLLSATGKPAKKLVAKKGGLDRSGRGQSQGVPNSASCTGRGPQTCSQEASPGPR